MKKKKNIIISIILIVITILVVLGVYFIGRKFNNDEYPYYHEITLDELENKVNNKDTFILVVTQTGCSHCEAFIPVVKKVSNEYKIDFYIYNRTNDYSSDKARVIKYANINGTPTTMFYIDGEEKTTINRLVGESTEYRLIEKLKSEGYIND